LYLQAQRRSENDTENRKKLEQNIAELKRKLDEEQSRRTRDQSNSQAVAERISSLEKQVIFIYIHFEAKNINCLDMYLQLMEANEKLKQETDSHNKTKKQNAEFAMGAAGREHTLLELQDKVAVLQRARDALEAESAALQVNDTKLSCRYRKKSYNILSNI
jgi:chromosome segregation ATPase